MAILPLCNILLLQTGWYSYRQVYVHIYVHVCVYLHRLEPLLRSLIQSFNQVLIQFVPLLHTSNSASPFWFMCFSTSMAVAIQDNVSQLLLSACSTSLTTTAVATQTCDHDGLVRFAVTLPKSALQSMQV